MRVFATLLALAGLFLVTGCKDEPVEQGEAGSSTPVVSIEDSHETCCSPREYDDAPCCALEFEEPIPIPAPTETSYSESGPIASAENGFSESEI